MPNDRYIPVVALVGGIGSGKSSLANWICEHFPVESINADSIGHEVLRLAKVKQQLLERFGQEIFDDEGEVIRPALGQLVFGSGGAQQAARADLEEIVHPLIRQQFHDLIDAIKAKGMAQAILLDAAVLLEAGWQDLCDAVVFVDTPRELRFQRVAQSRGWSKQSFDSREQSQLDIEEKRRIAQHTIDNSVSVEQAGQALWQWIENLSRHPLPQ